MNSQELPILLDKSDVESIIEKLKELMEFCEFELDSEIHDRETLLGFAETKVDCKLLIDYLRNKISNY